MAAKLLGGPGFPIPTPVHAFARIAVATLWLYEGLYLKVVERNPHELRIVSSAVRDLSFTGTHVMIAIGLAETILAFLIYLNLFTRPLAVIQFVVLLAMNLAGIVLGGGEIGDPIYLMVHNLPTFACAAVLATCVAAESEKK